jgi:dTDP-4-dehydrorhamnose 3,5-epimerase
VTTPVPFADLAAASTRRVDDRGSLSVLYEAGEVVLKRSYSRAGVFRGMHLQTLPHPQTKLIRVVTGRIRDFVIDPFAKRPWVYHKAIDPLAGWVRIDACWAHGFLALTDCEFEYICHGAYNEASERSWSIRLFLKSALGVESPVISGKDAAAPMLEVSGSTCLD